MPRGAIAVVVLLICWSISIPFAAGVRTYQTQFIAAEAPGQDADLYEAMADLVLPYGYPLEEHFVTTNDGYILRVFRIPHGKAGPPKLQKDVVYLQHALLDSSAGYVVMGPNRSLAFALADEGYDVWLGNVRGNRFSRNHTQLSPNDAVFWAFSWDEFAAIDLPATVNLVLDRTGAPAIQYVGYSQGTVMAFAAFSSVPELSRQIKLAVLLAPVAYVTHMSSLAVVAMTDVDTDQLVEKLGVHEFMPHTETTSLLWGELCGGIPKACVLYLSGLAGFNLGNWDLDTLPLVMQYLPAGTSVQNMVHWAQCVRAPVEDKLFYYNYGTRCENADGTPRACNQANYGQDTPPTYNLSSITVPLALFSGVHDTLSTPRDVELLLSTLAPGTVVEFQEDPAYAHLDFELGKDLGERLFPRVLDIMGRYANV